MSAKLSAPRIVISPSVSETRLPAPLPRPAQIRRRDTPLIDMSSQSFRANDFRRFAALFVVVDPPN